MFQSLASFFLAFFMFFSSLMIPVNTVTAPEDKSDFVPVVRFSVASDTHVGSAGDIRSNRVMKVLSLAASDAAQDPAYDRLDGVMFVGDITDSGRKDQFLGFLAAVNTSLPKEAQLMAVLAKSHDGNTLGKKSLSYFSSVSGLDTDWHYVMNGFHFIGLSASKTEGEQYGDYQKQWLIEQLDAAVADDAEKPIFVCHHEHVKNTVYGGMDEDGWGIDTFREIFDRYPQIVHFSGHSHYPLNDPRSVWQGEFTAVGTGAVKYAELTIDGENKIHPKKYKNIAQMWIVEVDANNTVRLRGFDALSGTLLCEYFLENVADASARTLTPEQQKAKSSAPVFADGARITKGIGSVTVDAASSTDGFPVFLYRAEVYGKNGFLKSSSYTVNNYWVADSFRKITISVEASRGDIIKVTAENAYGMRSNELTFTVK